MLKSRLALLATVLAALLSLTSRPRAYTDLELTLGTGNYQFKVNDVAGFKVFVSYFDALDQSGSNVNTDLAYLAGKGVNGIRIFPTGGMSPWMGTAFRRHPTRTTTIRCATRMAICGVAP